MVQGAVPSLREGCIPFNTTMSELIAALQQYGHAVDWIHSFLHVDWSPDCR